ncbi:MAG: Nif3-like dinuclear metal center hexameric protein, partial [Nostocoides sp.]
MTLLRDVVAALERLYPPDTAQSWDQVGLVSGDLDQTVGLVHFAVDPTQAVIDDAVAARADLLLTHHPLLLRGVHTVAATTAKGSAVRALIRGNLALYVAHTNADIAAGGVNDALASALELSQVEPLSMEEGQPLGRVGLLSSPLSLADFATRLGEVLPAAAGGIRVSGDPEATVCRVAVSGGAGDSLLDAARAARADVFVTADLRHHPVLEDRETSLGGPPYIVDAGHWATESLWLTRAAADLADAVAAAEPAAARLGTHICTLRTDPWTFTVG